jgi:signal transduction histidine kinase
LQRAETGQAIEIDSSSEERRLAALKSYRVLDSDPEPQYDCITALAADVFGAPVAAVSLVDRDRLWFKSVHGLKATEMSRELAFCVAAIEGDDVFVVPDATQDERFADSALVRGAPHARTYVGAPLVTPHGYRLGTLSLIFDRVTTVPAKMRAQLRKLAALVVHELEASRALLADRKARIEAIAANQAKSQFLASMSEEIRGQMKRLLDGARTLQQLDLGPEQRAIAETVERSAGALSAIITGSIDYAKIEAGWLDTKVTEFFVEDLILELETSYARLASAKGLRLQASVAPAVRGMYLADESRIRQVLETLVANALADAPEGEIVVKVDAGRAADPRLGFAELVFSVRDMGAGLAEDALENVFSPLAHGRPPMVRDDGGVLLGLPTCRRLCEHLGGWIEAQSEPGAGTIFRFGVTAEIVAPDAAACRA